MNIYTPTYLYIKQHSVTGLLYFGKTTKNPEKYNGSGSHWKNHLKAHGKDHITLWYCLFLDQESCTQFALNFCNLHNIGITPFNKSWANEKPENGLDGWVAGVKRTKESIIKAVATRANTTKTNGYYHTPESIKKTADAKRNKPRSPETKQKLSNANKGIPKSKEFSKQVSQTMKGRIQVKGICIHCGAEMQVSNLSRYHNDNCKFKIIPPQ